MGMLEAVGAVENAGERSESRGIKCFCMTFLSFDKPRFSLSIKYPFGSLFVLFWSDKAHPSLRAQSESTL